MVIYECESWTVKKAEHRRIDAFELWCCRRLLRVPWTAMLVDQIFQICKWEEFFWQMTVRGKISAVIQRTVLKTKSDKDSGVIEA